MQYLKLILILIIFDACRSTRIDKSVISPNTFEGDSTLFSEINNPQISYYDLSGIVYLTNTLAEHKQVSFRIAKPTLVWCGSSYFLIYPGQQIRVLVDKDHNIIFQDKNSTERTNQLLFQQTFLTLSHKIRPQFPGRTKDYPIDTILLFEKQIKSEIPLYAKRSLALMDSLATVFMVKVTFKKAFTAVFEAEQYAMLYSVIDVYKKELKENNLYLQKMRQLLPYYTNKTSREEVDPPQVIYWNSLADNIMPIKINHIEKPSELREAMDTINNNFKGLSKDFLLSKLLFHCIYRRVPITKEDLAYYNQLCDDVEYRQIIDKQYSERKYYNKQSKAKKDNRLIAQSNSKIYTLDEIINREKGKLLLLDFWASWCLPCLEQMPESKRLSAQYDAGKIKFIYLSTDRDIKQWQHRIEDIGMDAANSYLFENFDKQSFLKKIDIKTIPRYVLIDEEGEIIDVAAPEPGDPALKKLIDDHIKKAKREIH